MNDLGFVFLPSNNLRHLNVKHVKILSLSFNLKLQEENVKFQIILHTSGIIFINGANFFLK